MQSYVSLPCVSEKRGQGTRISSFFRGVLSSLFLLAVYDVFDLQTDFAKAETGDDIKRQVARIIGDPSLRDQLIVFLSDDVELQGITRTHRTVDAFLLDAFNGQRAGAVIRIHKIKRLIETDLQRGRTH